MKIFLTGATGFVGSRLAQALLERGHSLRALIRPKDERREAYWKGRGADVVRGSLQEPSGWRESLRGTDRVIHCAALMSNWESLPYKNFYETNVEGTSRLLDCVRLNNPGALFLHISTVNVLGPTPDGPADERAPYGDCLSKYGRSKREAEEAVKSAQGVDWIILRPAQLYGPGMLYGWPQTMSRIRAGRFWIFGDGKARLHLTHVSDVVSGVLRALEAGPEARGQIYHLAGPSVPTIGEIFNFLAEFLGSRAPRRLPYLAAALTAHASSFLPGFLKPSVLKLMHPQTIRYFKLDHAYRIDKAKREFGYEPRVFFREGLRQMAEGFLQGAPSAAFQEAGA